MLDYFIVPSPTYIFLHLFFFGGKRRRYMPGVGNCREGVAGHWSPGVRPEQYRCGPPSLWRRKKKVFLQPIMSIIFNWQLICCTDFYNLIVLYKTVLIYLFYLFFGTFTFSLSKYKLQGVRKSYKYIIIMFIWLHCSGITILILKNNNEAIVLFFWSWSLAQEQKRELTPLQWHKVAA